ncbi:MAG: type II toxin-antitoxin system HicB family antitoxin [Methanosarcinales archaeon]
MGEVLELPGCVTQAKTLEELNMRLKEAINGYIASLRDHGEPVPQVQVQIHNYHENPEKPSVLKTGILGKLLKTSGVTLEEFLKKYMIL